MTTTPQSFFRKSLHNWFWVGRDTGNIQWSNSVLKQIVNFLFYPIIDLYQLILIEKKEMKNNYFFYFSVLPIMSDVSGQEHFDDFFEEVFTEVEDKVWCIQRRHEYLFPPVQSPMLLYWVGVEYIYILISFPLWPVGHAWNVYIDVDSVLLYKICSIHFIQAFFMLFSYQNKFVHIKYNQVCDKCQSV